MRIHRRQFIASLTAAGAGLGLELVLPPAARAAKRRCPVPALEAAGSPGALGVAHGKAFARQIEHNLGFYRRWLGRATGAKADDLLRVAAGFRPVLARHLPQLLEEMDGIARGSGQPRAAILMLNARTDMLVMGARAKRGASKAAPGCTALALSGSRRRRGQLALGQNWDWRPDLAKGTVLLRLRPSEGPRVVTFTEAGMVGKIGMNEQRLGVCLNFLSHETESAERPYGLPVHCLLRAVMGCQSLEEAYKLVAWAPRCASANFLIAQHRSGEARALDLEWTPTALARLPLADGWLVHTNHFKDPALAPGCGSGRGRSTMNRNRVASRLARALRGRIADPAARMRRILASTDGAPYSVSKIGASDSPSVTLAGVVMDLSHNRLHLCAGQPHRSRWATLPGA